MVPNELLNLKVVRNRKIAITLKQKVRTLTLYLISKFDPSDLFIKHLMFACRTDNKHP